MDKIYVLDTNVLIHNPNALFSFGTHRVVIPIIVLEEIDQFKKNVDEKGRNARQVGRYLDALREQGSLQEGVETEQGGIIQVTVKNSFTETSNNIFFSDKNDNLIIGTALYFKENYPKSVVTLVSMDTNVRIKADSVGINAESFESDAVKFDELYTGIDNLIVTIEALQQMNEKNFLENTYRDFYPNQFVRLMDKEDNPTETIITRYDQASKTFYPYSYYKGQAIFGIIARNQEQAMALELLLDDRVKMVSLSGKAGTGKTLLAMAAGLHKVIEENKYTRLVISRPISPMGKDLGYLPGTKSEKFNPWMQPIYDNMDILIMQHNEMDPSDSGRLFGKKKANLQDYLDYEFIELEPLTYIRGRSLPNQFMIIDETQNLTPHEMKTIITRAGEGTKIVLTGDPYQIDIPYLDSESNGLSVAVEKLKGEEIVGHVTLEKGERSILADIAAKYF
ncbi:MAG TPA: PhoH family protein [Candidatus Cloacimonadota bacterium]|nr:PhoH family protein [Candidatus Cloacimonadota bacterium]